MHQPKLKNGRMGLYIGLLIAAIVAMWMLRQCSSPDSISLMDINKPHRSGGDTIDVAIEYSPLSLYRKGDTITGLNYDILEAIAKKGNLTIKYHPIANPELGLKGILDGYYDIVVSDIPVTSELKEQYFCTEPVFLDRQVLVQHRDSVGAPLEVINQLDLAGKEVWTMSGSPAVDRLRNLSAEIGDTIYVIEDKDYGAEQLFIMVATGDIERCVINEQMAKSLAPDYPLVDISTGISFTQFQSWIMRKDNNVLGKRIDSLLVDFKKSPAYYSLMNKYFPNIGK